MGGIGRREKSHKKETNDARENIVNKQSSIFHVEETKINYNGKYSELENFLSSIDST